MKISPTQSTAIAVMAAVSPVTRHRSAFVRIRILAALVVASLGLSGGEALAAPPPSKLALTGARIITVSGDDIAEGTILIENGRIVALGKDIKLPYDATEIDLEGKVVFPGMIDADSWQGLDRPNESLPVTPFVDVYDAVDPSRLYFEECLRNGITSLHVIPGPNLVISGLSRVFMPIGLTPDEMLIRAEVALKLSTTPKGGFDRMLQLETLRGTFAELERYLDRVAERRYAEQRKEDGKIVDVGPAEARKRGRELVRDEDLDDQHRNLVRLKDGRLSAFMVANEAMDVGPALTLANELGLTDKTVLVLGASAVRAVRELAKAKLPVVLSSELVYRDRDEQTGEVTETFVPKVIHDAGLKFALQPATDSSLAERFPTYQAARCIRNGVPRRVALKAITLHPAEMLGLGDQLGSIEVGKIANLVVFSGDPLDFGSWVEHVYVNGIHAYDRARDPRIQDLLPRPKKATGEPLESDGDAAEEGDAKEPKEDAKEAEPKADGDKPGETKTPQGERPDGEG